MEKFYIETYGCQMNEADSEYMASVLLSLGYHSVADAQDADIILVNTCSIREKAEKKVLSFLGRIKAVKKKRDAVIGVCGCVARQEGDRLIEKAPFVDMVFGPHHIHRLPEFLDRAIKDGERVVEVSDRKRIERDAGIIAPPGVRALVPIMQGCNNFCSFCIVPHVRGREVSRPEQEIFREVTRLARRGVKEVMFLGQNVNSYGHDLGKRDAFRRLLETVNSVRGIERIRFTTSHPKDLTDGLIGAFGVLEKLCPQMHLPVQSGSDTVLKRMNRKYDRKTYLEKVRKLKKANHEISITTDIIVGFPGETEDDFKQTISLMEEVQYDGAFSFKYSRRPGTKAAEFTDHVPDDIQHKRLEILQEIQKEMTYQKNRAMEGKTVPVLVEGTSGRDSSEFMGRTPCFRIVNFSAGHELRKGDMVMVTIHKGYRNSLKGEAKS